MTNEKAIQLLHRLSDEQFDGIHGDERREALEMAVRALFSQQTVNDSQGLVKDCISRKMAIDTIERNAYRHTYIDQIINIIKALPPAQPQWIPCSERLPEKNCRCLVTNDAWGAFEVDWNTWFDGRWLHSNDKPIAWMPLPEPYGGDAK